MVAIKLTTEQYALLCDIMQLDKIDAILEEESSDIWNTRNAMLLREAIREADKV